MKNRLRILSCLKIAALLCGSLGFISLAMAQYGSKAGAPATGSNAPTPATSATAVGDVSLIPRKSTSAPAKNTSGGGLSSADKNFMMAAAKGGMMEVEFGRVASDKAQNADVKKFGSRMVADHSKANDELKSIAAKKGVGLPNERANTSWKSDKKYMDMMVKDHEKDLAEFQQEAQKGSDPDVKKFADKTSKVIQKHLAMARDIDGKLK